MSLNPEQVRDKYREREREGVLRNILLKMEEFGITFVELEHFHSNNVIHLRDQILALRKKANVRRALDGRRKQETTKDRLNQQRNGEENPFNVGTPNKGRN